MEVGLARQYRIWMWALLPATLGVGTAALWGRSLSWPRSVDSDALTLRSFRRVQWEAIRRVTVQRDYLGGQVSRIDIHYPGGSSRIPVRALRDGESVAAAILAKFKQTRRTRPHSSRLPMAMRSEGSVEAAQNPSQDLEVNTAPPLVPKSAIARHDGIEPRSVRNDRHAQTHTAS
jgi:hypothetical protein